MAVASTSTSKPTKSGQKEKINDNMEKKKKKAQKKSEGGCSSPAKRTKCPGLRVIGGRIYDSENGKTCHQCRQKTMDFTAACMNLKGNKPCPIMFCHKCLLNRYGEKAEEVSTLEDWKCPKCRGVCNCSLCMKKRGHQPTGMLVHTAKATGFSSVSDMLHVNGPENCSHIKSVKNMGVSPKKPAVSDKEPVVVTPRKRGKENSFDGSNESNQQPLPQENEKKPKKIKREGLKEVHGGNGDNEVLSKKIKSKKHCISDEITKKEVKIYGMIDGLLQAKTEASEEVPSDPCRNGKIDKMNSSTQTVVECHKIRRNAEKFQTTELPAAIPLPKGSELTTLAGIDVPSEDVGHALQFLEFCATFGEILQLRKGQPESILRDIFCGRSGRSGKYTATIQFQIQLLSLIQEDVGKESPMLSPTHGKNSWLHALKNFVSESPCALKEFPFDKLDRRADAYDTLDPSKKIRLLNFLCDEVLGTVEIRNWIDDQNSKFAEKIKEAKERVVAAKDKEKSLRQKLQDEVARAIIARNGAPITISEHEAIVSQVKTEAAQAHTEMLESKGMVPKKKERSDAVRTEPVIFSNEGRAFWRLKAYSDRSEILLQEMGAWDAVSMSEKWFAYDVEQKEVLEKHIESLRKMSLRHQIIVNSKTWTGPKTSETKSEMTVF